MSVVVKTQSEMTFVDVQVTSIYCVFLNIHSFVDQQLLETIIQFLFLEELLELLLKVHHVGSLKLDS